MPFATYFHPAARGAALLLLLASSACTIGDKNEGNASDAMAENASEPVSVDLANLTLPVPRPPLDRGALIAAAGEAASRYARGVRVSESDTLVGRAFTLRLPFGCAGAAGSPRPPGLAGVAPGEEGAARLELAPADWTEVAWLRDGEGVERIEGYWIERPWLLTSECPAVAADPLQGGAASPQTLGIAQFHGEADSRINRRDGRPYSFVVRPPAKAATPAPAAGPAPAPAAAGYTLLMSGRIGSFPDGRAIRCRANGPAERPVCVVAVQLDRVAFETQAGTLLSDWRTG